MLTSLHLHKKSSEVSIKTRGAFHSTKTSGLNFRQLPIAGFHCHAIKIKIENHSMNEVKKFTRYRRYINKYSIQASGLCGIPYSYSIRHVKTKNSERNSIFRLTAPVMTIFRHFQKKKGQPREGYPNFRLFFPEVFFPFYFAPGISGKFSRKFLYHLPLFPNFRKFWLNGKPPRSTPASHSIQGQDTKYTTVKWPNGFTGLDVRLEILLATHSKERTTGLKASEILPVDY